MRKVTLLAFLLLFGFVSLELLDDTVTPGSATGDIHKMDGPGQYPPSPAP